METVAVKSGTVEDDSNAVVRTSRLGPAARRAAGGDA
jgi:hypothetical protein